MARFILKGMAGDVYEMQFDRLRSQFHGIAANMKGAGCCCNTGHVVWQ